MKIIKTLYFKIFLLVILIFLLFWQQITYEITSTGLNPQIYNSDLIVVFGTTVNPDGNISRLLRWRLDEAIHLYNNKISEKILVSGGKSKDRSTITKK